MKKHLLFVLAGFLFFAGSNELQAKAIKLGRSIGLETLSGAGFSRPQTTERISVPQIAQNAAKISVRDAIPIICSTTEPV